MELGELFSSDVEFDLDVMGFSVAEIDTIFDVAQPEQPGDPVDDYLPYVADIPSRVKVGDIWALGKHRLMCGDALSPQDLSALMSGQQAKMVFTDPPYNVPINGHVSGQGKTQHREFVMASGEMSETEFIDFLKTSFINMTTHSVDGSIHFICMDWRHMQEILAAGRAAYSELKNLITWVKDNGGMGTFYRSQHELIFAFKHGKAAHLSTFELGQHGRYRTNVWEYRGVNTLKTGRMDELTMHPTVKPVQMIADAIKDVSARGDIVLDIFAGSGSTMIAAHKTGRRAYLSEIDPIYCDCILARYEQYAHDDAILLHREEDVAGEPDSKIDTRSQSPSLDVSQINLSANEAISGRVG